MDVDDQARHVLAATAYAVLATAEPDGSPWVTPVWFAPVGLEQVLWVSRPETRHSRFIAQRPEIALTVFDSTVPIGSAEAFYARALATVCPEDELDELVGVFSARSVAQGAKPWTVSDITGDATLRLYVARVTESWVLATDGGPDRRLPLSR
jgi:hypothetical protein